jgi:outer membrane autotransporter protein
MAALGLIMFAPISPSHAQEPPLGTLAGFGVLAGSTVTNTGFTVIGTPAQPADVGVSPGSAVTGLGTFPVLGPGTVHGTIHAADATAAQAQVDLTTAYNALVGRTTTVDLTGQDLGGKTLVPGVYRFSTSAQLTGALTLNGLGNPNSVFIFNIGSTLTTASASTVNTINGAQGGHVFWRVGSSATLGTTTSFAGDILAQASITLNTGAIITCGAAWARSGAVTLDTNTITTCPIVAGAGGPSGGPALGPTGAPLFTSLLPSSANGNQRAVAIAIDTFVANGGTLPLTFLSLFNLSPSQLADAFSQLQGEAGTGAAQAGTQAMNSFLSLVTNPFAENRTFAPERPLPRQPLIYKAPAYKAPVGAAPDPRRWNVWAAGYGSQNKTTGDPVLVGSHDRSERTLGLAAGIDYRITPTTVAGFALGGGGTNFGLSGGFGGGHSDMLQAAVYSVTRVDAAYLSAALAYAWHRVSTDRVLSVAGTDDLTARFSANNVGGRIEGGYRFAVPDVFFLPGSGITPYAAFQEQAFRTPSYSEIAASGSPTFALAYVAQTTTTTRTELGVWFDRMIALDNGTILTLRSREAWAHDHWSDPRVTAMFQSLPGSSFTEFGAAPARDLLLSSAGAEVRFKNGVAVAGWFDSELAKGSQTYTGTARLSYMW